MRSRSHRVRSAAPALLAAVLSLVAAPMLGGPAPAAPSGASAAETGTHTVLVTGSRPDVREARDLASDTAGYQNLPIIGGFAADLTSQQVDALEASGLQVSENAKVTVTDADWGAGSHEASAVYPQVDGAPSAWASGLDGRNVGVAVVDTGISNTGDLAGRVIDGFDFSGEGSYTTDSFGHGTFVAGIIAGSGNASNGAVKGVAPGVNLVSLKVAGADGSSDVIRVISAIQWAVNHAVKDNIRVLNLSLGTDSTQSWTIDPLNAAVEGAWRAGMVVTVAAGNAGASGITKPGDDPYVITVGSTDDATTVDSGDDTVASFSSTGPTSAGVAKPDLVAPGAHLVSTRALGSAADTEFPASRVDPIYFRGSGTSFSAPQVSAAAALLLQQRPGLTNNQVKGLLTTTASPLPGVAATAQGAGALDIRALLAAPTGPVANQGLGRSDGSGSPFKSEGSLVHAGGPPRDTVAWNSAAWNSAAWNSAAWNSAAWNSAAWNSAAWNSAPWGADTDTQSAAWNAYRWSSAAWNGYDWHSAAWNSAAWNSAAWNSTAWSSAAWNSAAWNSAAWNAGGWASTGFWSAAWN
ncbi:peptidase S8 and S53 subtilisin kexin sedolisin [Nocardioides immobilis]|uniref:Peptidase S8 and S53 subtilisin kexin sedolisin n=1 Tax=Nocardioides immobilis TaxID=2049295 RepID=A0A417XYC8_9ACTN|nr:S8 family peptidase [Nocardioides immobilis]RHW25369.1 peptidase S8 and S53 subtilisin kexin sedolisin [Nocardioides immobilis]